jgi:hypothetical protein
MKLKVVGFISALAIPALAHTQDQQAFQGRAGAEIGGEPTDKR